MHYVYMKRGRESTQEEHERNKFSCRNKNSFSKDMVDAIEVNLNYMPEGDVVATTAAGADNTIYKHTTENGTHERIKKRTGATWNYNNIIMQ